jgi:probable rRNA maturation factor
MRAKMIEVAVAIGGPWGSEADWEDILTDAVLAAFEASPYRFWLTLPQTAEVAIRLTDDAEVQGLNASWRGKDKPTNVLSFPQMEREEIMSGPSIGFSETLFGDIVLARETCWREAEEKSVPMVSHATHLVVHGTLHLLGYDHQTDQEAEEMESLEKAVMASLGFTDPYALEGAN